MTSPFQAWLNDQMEADMTTRSELADARNEALAAYQRLRESADGTSPVLTPGEGAEGFFIAASRWAAAELAWQEVGRR